jgi:hypothetical protein
VPDIDRNIRQRLAVEISDPSLYEHFLAFEIGRHIRSMRHHLVLADIERPEHGGFGRALAFAVIDGIDQHRDAEHVGEQDEFLPAGRAFLADSGEEIDRIFPFGESEIGLSNEGVQRFDQLFHQELDPRFLHFLETLDNGGGEFGLVELGHLRTVLGVISL